MKIKQIKKIDTWTPDNKKYTMYSTWAVLEYQGKEVKGKVACFIKDLISANTEIPENEYDITVDQKSYQGDSYTQYTIKKKKQAWNKSGYNKTITYTEKEYFDLVQKIYNYTITLTEIDKGVLFGNIMNNAIKAGVKIENPIETVKEIFNGEELQNDDGSDVPF